MTLIFFRAGKELQAPKVIRIPVISVTSPRASFNAYVQSDDSEGEATQYSELLESLSTEYPTDCYLMLMQIKEIKERLVKLEERLVMADLNHINLK